MSQQKTSDFIGTFIVANDDTSWLFSKVTTENANENALLLKGLRIHITRHDTINNPEALKAKIKIMYKGKVLYNQYNRLIGGDTITIGLSNMVKKSSSGYDAPSGSLEEAIAKCDIWYPQEDFEKQVPYYFDIYITSNRDFELTAYSITYTGGKNVTSYKNNQLFSVKKKSTIITIPDDLWHTT